MQITGLAYIVAQSADLAAWRRFGEDVIGLSAATRADGGLTLKADERIGRIFIDPGRHDRYAASGWEVADERAFDIMLARLSAAGVATEALDPAIADSRGFTAVTAFNDPAGNRHELGWGYRSDFARFISPVGVPRFVMGRLGMGHSVLPAPNFDEMCAFYTRIMGFGLSDLMVHRPAGPAGDAFRIHFMHCGNARHHSLALFEGEVPSGCVHIMLEYPDMDEVGRALDRVNAAGARLTATLGRHVNDGVTSFYCATPGGFSIELGFGGNEIDWTDHVMFETTRASLWGHDFSLGFDPPTQGAQDERDGINIAA